MVLDTVTDALESLLEQTDGRGLVSVTVEVGLEDPSATVFSSRRAGDRWFCWEQPDRDGFALATLGGAAEVVSRGPGRFDEVAAGCAEVVRDRAAVEPDDLPAGAGPVWVGGFAFTEHGGAAPHWSSFPPALLVLPELALLRRGGRTLLTVCALAGGGGGAVLDRLAARLAVLRPAAFPPPDPHPTGRVRISSALPPDRYE